MSGGDLKGVVIGAGFFAGFQGEAWARMPGVKITAVADLNKQRAREFAAKWGIERSYTDAAEMIEREKPDFADIVTGPDTHRALAEMAAACGVHVICQKPMAPSWEECVAMVEACERAGVRLMIHENWRWQPWYRETSRMANERLLGRVFHLGYRMRTGDGRGSEPYQVQPYFRRMPRFLIFETIVHFLDTFRFLGGEIASVFCRSARINPIIAGEDYVLAQISFAGGANGVIDANRISGPLPPPIAFGDFRMEGDRAMVRVTPDGKLWFTEYGEGEREHSFLSPAHGYKGDSVWAAQRHMTECLREGKPCESDGRDYLKTVRAVLACYESAESGLPVSPEVRD